MIDTEELFSENGRSDSRKKKNKVYNIFSDDMTLVAEEEMILRDMLLELKYTCEQYGLKNEYGDDASGGENMTISILNLEILDMRNGHLIWISVFAKPRNSLQICQRKMLRRILGLSLRDRVPNEVLQRMSAIKDPALQATNTKWKWGGHVARLRDGRWTQIATLWDPRIGKRSRGRPRRRWTDFFSERVGSHWSSRARNREDWKNLRRQVNSD
ncbi:hypothetical protein ANN_13455 [Periplaneta americana]|uniref:Uncharacterized protein n=1 Tax=Periplaneta americana TaxID=6978 RepID=A0ABQ8TJH3_PERAM|nr:hypothetical protein ANN_13455 [Periplaneta americana]